MKTLRICLDCGTPLPPDAPGGLCPQCLLKSDAPTYSGGTTGDRTRAVPIPGGDFGSYRIVRLLGQGGMGEVYEAEHVTDGRRVALKVMSHELGTEQDRKRFLREGRLAASVNHPNVVYVFGSEEIEGVGSEEIEGIPTIAMELLPGGTLKDRVKE